MAPAQALNNFMLLYTCISSHGYGHASRTASVLCELARRAPECRLVISTAVDPGFLQLAMGDTPFELRPCRWDIGMLQANALDLDPAGTLKALEGLEGRLPAQVEAEAAWLAAQPSRPLILADVPPSAALLAKRLDCSLIWLASFGWDAIYRPIGGAFVPWADLALDRYRQGDLLLRCPLSLPMDWDVPSVDLGITSSTPRVDPGLVAQRLNLPSDRERCVLVSFGGLGMAMDPTWLSLWPDHVFVGVDPLLLQAPNGRLLPPDLRPLDVMPLVARMITKPGYSSFCEAFQQGVGLHVVRREGFAEAPVLEMALKDEGWHRFLDEEAFRRGAWDLDAPLLAPRAPRLSGDGSHRAAELLHRLLADVT
ncbi:MAG: hypothetical protein VKO19_10495 [Cyanobacteriota bacterium]|nr:hypothetical protein [Cyanobacteriota bacterium]